MRNHSISFALAVAFLALLFPNLSGAETIPVRHIEGVTFGFLVLRTVDGKPIAYGNLKQVVTGSLVMHELVFHFKDGSLYDEITKFTQKGEFRLVSDQVVQKGPAFKQDSESWIDAASGNITVRTYKDGKTKETSKHLDVPADVANGLVFTIAKNIDPSVETVVPMVAASDKPRIVKLHISPAEGKVVKLGAITFNTQHFVVKTKIEGAAGVIAPIMGKQPPDAHIWIVKSEAPTFVEFEGPISEDSPVWRIELMAPEPDAPNLKIN